MKRSADALRHGMAAEAEADEALTVQKAANLGQVEVRTVGGQGDNGLCGASHTRRPVPAQGLHYEPRSTGVATRFKKILGKTNVVQVLTLLLACRRATAHLLASTCKRRNTTTTSLQQVTKTR
jgi:hypothetical protein